MALLGKAALAMWWNMAAPMRDEFSNWHSHEHFPERLAIPGFLRSSRWMSAEGTEGVFVMYELADYDVLASTPYLDRLNAPSPWSTRLMPHHRNMIRSQSHVLESSGGTVGSHLMTVRLSAQQGREQALRSALRPLMQAWAAEPGLVGAHLLQHQTPDIPQTTEQSIRGARDQVADLVLVVAAYDLARMQAKGASDLSPEGLERLGAAPGAVCETWSLAYSAIPADTA